MRKVDGSVGRRPIGYANVFTRQSLTVHMTVVSGPRDQTSPDSRRSLKSDGRVRGRVGRVGGPTVSLSLRRKLSFDDGPTTNCVVPEALNDALPLNRRLEQR